MVRKQEIEYPFYGRNATEEELTEEQKKFLTEFHFKKQKLFQKDNPEFNQNFAKQKDLPKYIKNLLENRELLRSQLHLVKLLTENNIDYRVLSNTQLQIMKTVGKDSPFMKTQDFFKVLSQQLKPKPLDKEIQTRLGEAVCDA